MASFFQTYKQMITVTVPSAFQSTGVSRYTCPANCYAFIYVTYVLLYAGELIFYNFSRQNERAYFFNFATDSSSKTYTGSVGMLILGPGESVYTGPLGSGVTAEASFKVFEFVIASS